LRETPEPSNFRSPAADNKIRYFQMTATTAVEEEKKNIHGVWERHARQWQRVGAPLRPSEEDGRLMMELANLLLVQSPRPRIVVMGVTPELVKLPWPDRSDLLALDHSAEMIARVWEPHPRIQSSVRQARWQAMPLENNSVDVVVGDGSLNVLPRLEDYAGLYAEVARVLRPGGGLIVRCFVRPDVPEPMGEVVKAALNGQIQSFHALKWRVAMALGVGPDYSVAVSDIHAAFNRHFPDRNRLAELAGWAPETIDTIDAYQGAATRYTFPTLDALRIAAAGLLDTKPPRYGGYELSGRCPTLLMTLQRP
jgi:SAM-dependent methyltransferase